MIDTRLKIIETKYQVTESLRVLLKVAEGMAERLKQINRYYKSKPDEMDQTVINRKGLVYREVSSILINSTPIYLKITRQRCL